MCDSTDLEVEIPITAKGDMKPGGTARCRACGLVMKVEGLGRAPETEEAVERPVPPEVLHAQTTCWFCGKRPPTTGSELMLRVATEDLARASGKDVDPLLQVEVLLQRCLTCKRIHERPKTYGGYGCFVGFGFAVLAIIGILSRGWKNEMFLIIILGPLVWAGIGAGIGAAIGWFRNRGSETRPLKAAIRHPAYQHCLATDWAEDAQGLA